MNAAGGGKEMYERQHVCALLAGMHGWEIVFTINDRKSFSLKIDNH